MPDPSAGVTDPFDEGEDEINAAPNLSIGVADPLDKGENAAWMGVALSYAVFRRASELGGTRQRSRSRRLLLDKGKLCRVFQGECIN